MMKKLLTAIFAFALLIVSAAAVDASVVISPANPGTADTLTGTISGGSGAYTHYWYKNAILFSSVVGTTSATSTIGPSSTARGDVFDFKGYDYVTGNLLGQTCVTILNTPPTITAYGHTPQTPTVGQPVTFSMTATDPDVAEGADSLQYRLIITTSAGGIVWSSNSNEPSSINGLVYDSGWGSSNSWQYTFTTSGTYNVFYGVRDQGPVQDLCPGGSAGSGAGGSGSGSSQMQWVSEVLTVLPASGTATVNLDSRQSQLPGNPLTINLGTTIFNSIPYTLANTINNVAFQTYNINYTPAAGFQFLNWATTGGLAVANPNVAATTVSVSGNGNLTAVYGDIQAPVVTQVSPANNSIVNVTCSSGTANATFTVTITDNAGNIPANIVSVNLTLNGANYAMSYVSGNTWTYTATSLAVGTYTWFVTATDASGNIGTSATRTFTVSNVNCGGNIYTVNLADRNITSMTLTNVGNITFNSVSYTLPATVSNIAGNTYSISYTPVSGFTFDHWENNMTTGTITFGNTNAQSTTATVAGNGTIMAVYKPFVNSPPQIGNFGPVSGADFIVRCGTDRASVTITAVVTDDTGVQTVIAEVNGANYTLSRSGSTYSATLNLPAGTYTYKIIATDVNGQQIMSATRTFTVDDSTCEGGDDSLLVYAQLADDEQALPGQETYILVKMYNTGNSDIQDVQLKIVIPDFPFIRTIGPFDVVPGWNSKIIHFDVPEDAVPGHYDVQVNVFNDDLNRIKYRVLTVVGDQPFIVGPVTPIQTTPSNEAYVKKINKIPLLIAAVIILLLLIAGLLYAKKREDEENQH